MRVCVSAPSQPARTAESWPSRTDTARMHADGASPRARTRPERPSQTHDDPPNRSHEGPCASALISLVKKSRCAPAKSSAGSYSRLWACVRRKKMQQPTCHAGVIGHARRNIMSRRHIMRRCSRSLPVYPGACPRRSVRLAAHSSHPLDLMQGTPIPKRCWRAAALSCTAPHSSSC